jgi:hypothetical protein
MAVVQVPPGKATEIAQMLLAKAAAAGMDPSVVATQTDGFWGLSFVIPDELMAAPVEAEVESESELEPELEVEPETPKKRGRPKKSAASEVEPETEEL